MPKQFFIMPTLQELHQRLQEKKAQRKDIKQSFQDQLRNSKRYMDIIEEMEKLRSEKKSIENEILNRDVDVEKLEELAADIKTDVILLADVALNMYISNQSVEIVDEQNARWVPLFTVRFKKS
ncbi:MAG: hypothetical protein UY72_C0028G0003 [Candidatus Uhrbacteria bacterium GW2011_GWD2_52_7]|uniref:Uncharacterized protein n=1 Tax=Candidatus Uhrbacteria bacterium GW2011_GWD2_52_7 TaxID=1618989 RepID=A0A0G1XGA6_9BACT|nr:MAG: hypothetical protein UY72_C0028G0003 [Candidatus Uhrbacteria bacterium GW2011_GWD2_52_7]